jgi:transketolase
MEVMQPGNKGELDALIRSQYANGRPSYFRLAADSHEEKLETRFGKGHILLTKNARPAVVTAGLILKNVLAACKDLDLNLLYLHTIKPIDTELLFRFANTDFVVVHDAFGLFEAVSQAVGQKARYIGLPDRFIDCYGTLEDVRQTLGLSARGIREQLERMTHA